MKRHLVLLAVLGLFLIAIVNPSLYLDSCTRGIELNEKPFFTAADGDESSESITSFNETTADDQMYSLGSLGWQHDCSTMTNVTQFDGVVSSDGDKISIRDATVGLAIFWTDLPTNATVESDDFPFAGVSVTNVNATKWSFGYSHVMWPTSYADFTWFFVDETDSGIFHTNTKAAGIDPANFAVMSEYGTVEVDWCKAYSITNFTVSSPWGVNDFLYVNDVGGLVFVDADGSSGQMLNYDPPLSVATGTYNVWNFTCDDTPNALYFKTNIGGWEFEIHVSQDTRGDFASGTLTDFYFTHKGNLVISALKFIEDSTAPDILDKFVTPIIPDDDESVTLTVVTYDAVEVYEVTANAVVYPAGFNDIDYDLTEQTDDVLWSYEFSTLTAGYYLFQVTANDGANTYSEYIPVTVRVSIIEITTYTFFGASSDFSYMQYSGYINRDCTYNISEWSNSWAKNETHTGSVSEGMFNIAWDKIGVDDTEANFTIVFVSGSLSLTIEGYYGTAYKLLRITEIEVHNPEESQANTSITVNFYTNKDVDWFVYDVDDSDAVLASGSAVEGSDDLSWSKDTMLYIHNYAIKWTDGVSNIWFNSSYWTYRENIDSIDQAGADWEARDTRRTIEFWTTLTAIVLILGLTLIGISHYRLDKKIKALQLPRYNTQEK